MHGAEARAPFLRILEAILRPCWGHLGRCWGYLVAFRGHLRPSWAHAGAILGLLGTTWDHLEAIFGHLGAFVVCCLPDVGTCNKVRNCWWPLVAAGTGRRNDGAWSLFCFKKKNCRSDFITLCSPSGAADLLTIPSGITAAPSNLACRFVAVKGKVVLFGCEGHFGAHFGRVHIHVEA